MFHFLTVNNFIYDHNIIYSALKNGFDNPKDIKSFKVRHTKMRNFYSIFRIYMSLYIENIHTYLTFFLTIIAIICNVYIADDFCCIFLLK